MAQDLGGIYYEVDLETGKLIASVRKTKSELDDLSKNSDTLNTSLSRLSSTIKLVIASSALREMASMVQKYQEMADRVRMATASTEEFDMVQKRLLKTANGTFRSLSEAQELYIRSADGLRSMGYSTQQAIDVQDSMSYAFVKNAASADRANAAISAFTKSINTGRVSADQWESITTAIPTVINDIAAASGKSAAQVRALGAAGKLAASDLSEGLRKSLDENAEAAKGMSNNLTDASVRIKTAITAVLVAAENQTGALQSFTNGLISAADAMLNFSEDSDGMTSLVNTGAAALTAFAAVMGGRYTGSFYDAIKAKTTAIATTIKQQSVEVKAAQAAISTADAEIKNAKATIASEQAKSRYLATQSAVNKQYGLNVNYQSQYAQIQKTIAAQEVIIQAATERKSAAVIQASVANRVYAASALAVRGAMSFLGGPAGVVMIAASAIFYFWQKAQQAKQEAIAFADGLDTLNASMKSMSNTQLRGTIADANESIIAQKSDIKDLQDEVEALRNRYKNFTPESQKAAESLGNGAEYASSMAAVSRELDRKVRDLADKQEKLSKTTDSASEANRLLTNNMLTSMGVHDGLIEKGSTLERVQGAVAKAFGNTADEINRANMAGQNFKPSSLSVDPATDAGDKYNGNLEEQNQLLKIQDERLRAVTKARLDAQKVTSNPNQIAAAERLAGENYDLQKAQEARNKAAKDSESQDKRSAASADSAAQKLASLKQQSELAADSNKELSREQAILRAEQSIGKDATEAQRKEAASYAAAIWDTANAIKAQAAAEKLIPERQESTRYAQETKDLKTALGAKKITQDEFNKATERAEQQHQSNLAKIRADAVVSPLDDARGSIDPVQQLANENTRKLALIQQFETEKGKITANGLALMNAANRQYEQQRLEAQWEIFRNQSQSNELLAASLDGLQSGASSALTGLINGTQSLQEAFANIGTTILNSVISSFVQMGIEWVKAQVMGQAAATAALASTTAQATLAASAWAPAAVSASIATMGSAAGVGQAAYSGSLLAAKGMAVAGARKNGGPVSAGEMYRVGEGGMPEIYQASSGRQYMIPGDNGKVISNKDMQGGGGEGNSIVQHITFEINTTGGIDQATMQQIKGMMKQVALFHIDDQATRPGGKIQPRR
ncbi:tape measure protein [Klebsiella sp. Ap-873]|nr:tape measure protein [Klebsiella sp. Ap-873]